MQPGYFLGYFIEKNSRMEIHSKKLKMDQVWKGDVVYPVTVLSVEEADTEKIDEIKEGEKIRVTGISKGKGFQGVVKRHGFGGGPKTHGQKNCHRAPGSLGPTAPQRVLKGRKMAGHTGMERVTIKNLEVVEVNKENRLILVNGAVPGMRGTKIIVRK